MDDLGGSMVGFKFKLIPFKNNFSNQNLDYKSMLLYFANSLGLVVENDVVRDVQGVVVVNLRKRSLFLV